MKTLSMFFGIAALILSTLVTFGLMRLMFFQKIPRSGDALVGYGWTIIFLNLALLAGLAIAAAAVGSQGGFSWTAKSGIGRFLIVTAGLLMAAGGAAMAGFFKGEPAIMPAGLRFVAGALQVLIPILAIAGMAALLRSEMSPTSFARWSLALAAGTGTVCVAAMMFLSMAERSRNTKAAVADKVRFEDQNHQRMLAEIDSADLSQGFAGILVFTDKYHDADIRERAVARVKEQDDWQQQLASYLTDGRAPEAFTFLASNPVDDPDMFRDALYEGILAQAAHIRTRIHESSHPSHFYPELFQRDVEKVLDTVKRFRSTGRDYTPAIRELRAALNEPSEFEKPEFRCAKILDRYLK